MTRYFGMTFLAAVGMLAAALTPSAAQAIVFAQHTGSADPTTEGWTVAFAGSGNTFGPVDDGGTPAWFVDDASASLGTAYFYGRNLTPAEVAAAANPSGWTLSTTLRVPSTGVPTLSNSPFLSYRDGVKIWEVGFDRSGGATSVLLHTDFNNPAQSHGLTFTLAANSDYNTFELRYDPSSLTADLFVDGIERISNYGGVLLADTPRVLWGAGGTTDIGRGNFNAVTFMTTVPEAGSLLLVGVVGCATLVVYSVRRAVGRRNVSVCSA